MIEAENPAVMPVGHVSKAVRARSNSSGDDIGTSGVVHRVLLGVVVLFIPPHSVLQESCLSIDRRKLAPNFELRLCWTLDSLLIRNPIDFPCLSAVTRV